MMSYTDGSGVSDGAGLRQERFWGWMDQTVRRLVVQLIEKILNLEIDVQLAAGWNQRSQTRRGYRNGTYRRSLLTPQGPLQVKIPRPRQGRLDCSAIFDRYQRRIGDVDRIVRHAYLLGTSTRGTAELAEQVFGGSLSHQTVSQMMRWLDEQVVQWRQQPIASGYKVIYVDGMHVNVVGQDRVVMLICGLREAQGPLEVLDFCISVGEQCVQMVRRLRQRGLEAVELFVSDNAAAIRSALEEIYPEVPWQSCTFHRLQALRAAVGPTPYRHSMLNEASRIFRCPSRQAAVEVAQTWAARWRHQAPGAVQEFMLGLADSLMFYNLATEWWNRTRTNNPLERLIATLRMRLSTMGCFHDERAVERAVFGQLARWHLLRTYTQ